MSGFEADWSAGCLPSHFAPVPGVGVEPTASDGLSIGGLPVAYPGFQSGRQDLNLRSRGSRPRDHSRLVHVLIADRASHESVEINSVNGCCSASLLQKE